MPYGQMGYMASTGGGGGGGGGGWGLPDWGDLWDAGVAGLGTLAQNVLTELGKPAVPAQTAGIGTVVAGAAGGLTAEAIEALIAKLSGGGNGNGAMAPGGLFRPSTTSMKARPVSKIQVMNPSTGRCETWLHAVPKGWKINQSNVSGRRRHHHHPR